MPRLLAVVALALAALTATPARAQIVNVQSALSHEAPEGLSGSVDAAVDWRTGNTRLLVLSAAPVARLRFGQNLFDLLLRGELGVASGDRIIAKTFEHLRFRRAFTERITGEVVVQHEYDEFRRLQLRALAGAGPKILLILTTGFDLSWGIAYMLEHERLKDDGQIDAGQETTVHRISTYFRAHGAIADRLDLSQTLYAQPRIDEPGDLRILSETQLTVKATEKVAFKTAFSLAYDSEPPATIAGLDTVLRSSISIAFP
jgi:hypothetical protein